MAQFKVEVIGDMVAVVRDEQFKQAKALTAAMRQVGQIAAVRSRAALASAGFGGRWQQSVRGVTYPKTPRVSLSPVSVLSLGVKYAAIFERGGDIVGRPLLWLPLATLPVRMTPAQYVASVGPLTSINRPGHPPLLAGKVRMSATSTRPTLAQLRRGAKGRGGPVRAIPLFVGVPRVRIPQKYDLHAIARAAADQLPALYRSNLKD